MFPTRSRKRKLKTYSREDNIKRDKHDSSPEDMDDRMEGPNLSKKLPLYLGTSIESLEALVRREDIARSIKNVHRLPPILRKLKPEIFNQTDDQEKCFLLSKRYIYMVELLYELHEDTKFVDSMFGSDYEKVKKILFDVTIDLRERYIMQDDSEFSDNTVHDSGGSQASTVTDPGERNYILPTKIGDDPSATKCPASDDPPAIKCPASDGSGNLIPNGRKIFQNLFIKPAEFYNAVMAKEELLVIDIRTPLEYQQHKIVIEAGAVINIPANLIAQGDSAHILGKKLDADTQEIWERRETFQVMVLVDNESTKHDYIASKMPILRNMIVTWDVNKKYNEHPVILNGGVKELIEWYPSLVNNTHIYLLNNCNVEIEELLDIESVVYPEPGTTSGVKQVKKYSVYSMGLLDQRIARDFGPSDKESGDAVSSSRSEGDLPADAYISIDVPPGPFESTSEPFLTPPQVGFVEEIPDIMAEYPEVVVKKPRLSDEQELQDIIQESRDILLKKARAVKPQTDIIETIFEPSKKDETIIGGERGLAKKPEKDLIQSIEGEPPICQITTKDMEEALANVVAVKPIFDRTQKPVPGLQKYPCPGEGFTGLKNVKNICYMNTMLQSIKVIPVIKNMYVTTNLFKLLATKKPAFINNHVATVIQELWKGFKRDKEKRQFFIRDFKAKMALLNASYDLGHHEDTFEFFTLLFTQISQDCEYDIPKPAILTESQRAWISHLGGRSSFYVDVFFYQLKNVRECRQCKKNSSTYEVDSTLMLSLPDTSCSVEQLIWDYLKDTPVSDYGCAKCKIFGSLVHKKQIILTPDVLVIVLKRYKIGKDGRIVKNRVPVKFPKTNLQFGYSLYKLYAVPQHTGTTDAGHYFTTVLLDDVNDQWYTFNDEHFARDTAFEADTNIDIGPNCVGFFYVKTADCDTKPSKDVNEETKEN